MDKILINVKRPHRGGFIGLIKNILYFKFILFGISKKNI